MKSLKGVFLTVAVLLLLTIGAFLLFDIGSGVDCSVSGCPGGTCRFSAFD